MDSLKAFRSHNYSPETSEMLVCLTFEDSMGFRSEIHLDEHEVKNLMRRLIVAVGEKENPGMTSPHYTAYVYNGLIASLPATNLAGDAMRPEDVRQIQEEQAAANDAFFRRTR